MKVSVVTSLYNSESYLDELVQRLSAVLESVASDHEIILVNDASPDNSLQKAVALQKDNKLVVVDLSRNFGQHKAIVTGLSHASGDLIFMMDSDLEEKPELIRDFIDEYNNETDVDVIYGVQKKRKGNLFERLSGSLFYTFFGRMVALETVDFPTPFRLMTRRYVQQLLEHREYEFFFHGISVITGFNQKGIEIVKGDHSPSNYSLRKKINLFISSVTSFSNKPLVSISILGIVISGLGAMYLIYIILRYVLYGTSAEGWNSLIVSIWLIGGLTIFCIGIVGLYLSKIYLEVKNRPFTIIKKIYKRDE